MRQNIAAWKGQVLWGWKLPLNLLFHS